MNSKALIIPAAGSGSRMGEKIPKPYLKLSDSTILEHTVRRFLPLEGLVKIIVVTSHGYLKKAKDILNDIIPQHISSKCVEGGEERQHSISNALQQISDEDLIIVHDAVRPFVKLKHIQNCCRAATDVGAAVLGVPAKDTIKRVDDKQFIQDTPSRDLLWQTQTPQIFQKQVLVEAYKKAKQESFFGTDDSSLVERLDKRVKMVKGDQSNIKITYPIDLKLAQLLIGSNDHE